MKDEKSCNKEKLQLYSNYTYWSTLPLATLTLTYASTSSKPLQDTCFYAALPFFACTLYFMRKYDLEFSKPIITSEYKKSRNELNKAVDNLAVQANLKDITLNENIITLNKVLITKQQIKLQVLIGVENPEASDIRLEILKKIKTYLHESISVMEDSFDKFKTIVEITGNNTQEQDLLPDTLDIDQDIEELNNLHSEYNRKLVRIVNLIRSLDSTTEHHIPPHVQSLANSGHRARSRNPKV